MSNYKKLSKKLTKAGQLTVRALVLIERAHTIYEDADMDDLLPPLDYNHVASAKVALAHHVFNEHIDDYFKEPACTSGIVSKPSVSIETRLLTDLMRVLRDADLAFVELSGHNDDTARTWEKLDVVRTKLRDRLEGE